MLNPSHNRDRLDTPIEGLLSTPTTRLPFQDDVLLRSFVLQRDAGPAIVYNSPGLSSTADEISALGQPTRLLINHAHEGMFGAPDLVVPVWVHANDRREIGDALPVAGTFDGPETLDGDLQVVPTPGHTAGTTSYLWDSGRHRFLFTGDFIWVEDGEWKAVVLDESLRASYVESLEQVRDLEFDVLVPWGVSERDEPVFVVRDEQDKRDRLTAIIGRVAGGGSR